MDIIPAIDIIDGKCVRLSKGDFSQKTIYYDDPLIVAREFEQAGITRLHLVDLDGAKVGSIKNIKVLEQIAAGTSLIIDFGGGVKKSEDLELIFNAGACIVTLGSIAVRHPERVEEWILEYGPAKILVGADVLDNNIKISGWLEDGGIDIFEFLHKMSAVGVTNIFCTDISKDGMMSGISDQLLKDIKIQFPEINLVASGGVSNLNDLIKLKEIGCKGVIIGKAIYEGLITLEQLSEFNTKN